MVNTCCSQSSVCKLEESLYCTPRVVDISGRRLVRALAEVLNCHRQYSGAGETDVGSHPSQISCEKNTFFSRLLPAATRGQVMMEVGGAGAPHCQPIAEQSHKTSTGTSDVPGREKNVFRVLG